MSRDLHLYLEDMVDAASKALRYVSDMSFDQFIESDMVFDAVVRNLEVIGEAARHIPENMREDNPTIPWAKLVGFRNVLAHAYTDLDEELIWDTLTTKLPELVEHVTALIKAYSPSRTF